MDRKRICSLAVAGISMAVLILDTKTGLQAASQGVILCLQTLIPSLFPFFVVSNLLTSALSGAGIRPVEKLLRIPEGSGGIFLTGLLGGYPVGARAVGQSCDSGLLSDRDARRMLAFCSNAGPSFLFGMGVFIFREVRYCWLLWGIHILSAIVVGILTPGNSLERIKPGGISLCIPAALKNSVQTMALVCGWVVIFRVILGFCQRWFLWLLPQTGQVIFSGILELANGCCRLPEIRDPDLKLILCAVFLGFGGLCVALQTVSVAGKADTTLYLPGKLCQSAVSFLLCLPFVQIRAPYIGIGVCCLGVCGIYYFYAKKLQNRTGNPVTLGV